MSGVVLALKGLITQAIIMKCTYNTCIGSALNVGNLEKHFMRLSNLYSLTALLTRERAAPSQKLRTSQHGSTIHCY